MMNVISDADAWLLIGILALAALWPIAVPLVWHRLAGGPPRRLAVAVCAVTAALFYYVEFRDPDINLPPWVPVEAVWFALPLIICLGLFLVTRKRPR